MRRRSKRFIATKRAYKVKTSDDALFANQTKRAGLAATAEAFWMVVLRELERLLEMEKKRKFDGRGGEAKGTTRRRTDEEEWLRLRALERQAR